MAQQTHINDGWYINNDIAFEFTVYQEDGNGVLSTTPQDITGYGLRWDLRKTPTTAGIPILSKSTDDGQITILDGPNGICSVAIDAEDTEALKARLYAHALKRTDTGSQLVLAEGRALLQRAATV